MNVFYFKEQLVDDLAMTYAGLLGCHTVCIAFSVA